MQVPGSESSTYKTFVSGSESKWEREFQLPYRIISGVTTRGEVRQLPQGAKRQGALGDAFGRRIVCFALQNSADFLKRETS